ncbi:hypothetical protein DEH83_10010 [Streptococcus constellatus]|nr:hypothetical protein DEH83_00085 [Streptococcus constellatus]UTX65550.1 hypothetical protein DEH83_10010 [Streptococcus constellatus]
MYENMTRKSICQKKEVIGKVYGKLTVEDVYCKERTSWCRCSCSCGSKKDIRYYNLVSGRTKSCGCLEYENRHKCKNVAGKSFGDLLVTRKTDNRKNGLVVWECTCQKCGEIHLRTTKDLHHGWKTTCSKFPKKRTGRKTDLSGRRFGRLKVINDTFKRDYKGSVIWNCLCDCGNKKEYSEDSLVHGHCTSCGCKKREITENIRDQLTFVNQTCIEWLKFRKTRKDNTSGFRGVSQKNNGKYQVRIGLQRKSYHLGSFDTFEQAVAARLEAEKLLHGGFIQEYEKWQEKAIIDPQYAAEHPFQFHVKQIEGRFYVSSSVTE